jgi:type I restriction enzyme M protein
MATIYETPVKLRTIEKMLSEFVCGNGLDMSQVFNNWLEYIIEFFSVEGYSMESRKSNSKQDKFFYGLMAEWIQATKKQIAHAGWYDAFGYLYESLVVSKSKTKLNAQFFTPPELCNLTVRLRGEQEKLKEEWRRINDPTCGSGRILLAFHAYDSGNYLYGEDVDRTCCMMAVCNFLIHGCVGEIIWRDTLKMDWRYGWNINKRLNNPFSIYFGIPSVSELKQEERHSIKATQTHN